MGFDDPTSLEQRLGVRPGSLSALAALTPDELAHLDAAVDQAMRRETEALESGALEALRFVPRPLRGYARSLLFPTGGGAVP